MHAISTTIRARRRDLGLTLQRLADAAGCTRSYLSQIETGYRQTPPSRDLLERLERALRLAPGALTDHAAWLAMPEPLRNEVLDLRAQRESARRVASRLRERSLDDLYRSGELAHLVNALAPQPAEHDRDRARPQRSRNVAPVALTNQVPLINRVVAGYPTEFTDLDYPARIADEYVAVPEVHDPDAFAARVVGESMLPDYREGDIVVFSPERAAAAGDDCFVRLERDAETTFKRVYFESDEHAGERIRLQPLNPAFAPRTLPREEVAGLYVAVSVIRPVQRSI
ncbi:MAG: helix-turn-helix domain-containing protein [Phycisphaerales bacterium]